MKRTTWPTSIVIFRMVLLLVEDAINCVIIQLVDRVLLVEAFYIFKIITELFVLLFFSQ